MKLSSFIFLIIYVLRNPKHINSLLNQELKQKEGNSLLLDQVQQQIKEIKQLKNKLKREKNELKKLQQKFASYRKMHHESAQKKKKQIQKLKETRPGAGYLESHMQLIDGKLH